MKRLATYIIFLLVGFTIFCSCSKPRIIPDGELKDIFKEVFLSNAYFANNRGVVTDSLDVYRTILKKHGYTLKDLEETVGNFSKRKSAKISDVLEKAIDELGDESRYYDERVAVLDTIDSRAARRFARTVHFDTLIEVKSVRDTSKLRIYIPVRTGTYQVSYNYFIDTTDKNTGLRTTLLLIDTTGKRGPTTTNWMSARRRQSYNTKMEATDADSLLQIFLANYQEKMSAPALTVDSLKVVYYLPREVALDSLAQEMFPYAIPQPDYAEQPQAEADSSSLRLLPADADPLGGGGV